MSMQRRLCLIILCLTPFLHAADSKDEDTVRAAGLRTDPESLLRFLRERTLTDEDRRAIEEQIRQFGSRSFAARERAFEAVKKRGPSALPYLKAALTSKDIEVIRRAERCLAEIDRGPGPELPAAAVRLLLRKPPAGAVPVLVGYLPNVEDENVEEAVLEALVKLTPEKGKPDPALVAALRDDQAPRRAAAGYVLGRRAEEPVQAEVRKLLADRDMAVRFRAAQGLLAGRDRSAVTALPPLLAEAPLGIAWQVEELLVRLAGEDAPAVSLGSGDAETRTKVRTAWEQWWKKHGERADLARVGDVRRLLGLTLGIEYNTARIWECGPDGNIRWEITNLHGPMEAWVLPGNRILIADGNDVTERDMKGTVLRTIASPNGGPTGCQRLPSGNTFVSSYDSVSEYDRDGKKLYEYNIGGSNAIRKHKNGNIIYATDAFIIEMDTSGARVRSIPIPRQNMWVGIEDIGNNRFVVANSNTGRVIEVDADGKIHWEAQVAGACGVTRLPGGNTLVATAQRVVELDRNAKIVWEKKTTGYVRRVHRR
jgi:HEAT repeat protein